MEKNLGHATAYGYAKSKGYSGTEDEFAQLMADYASVGQSAAQSAEQAAASATSASGSAATATQAAQTATSKASEAVTAADTATTKASEASTSADTASAAATSAGTSAQTATTAAATATTKASEAAVSANTAATAKTDAESARDAAAQSASEAAESARTLTIDATLTQSGQAADAKATGDAITELKNDLAPIQSDLHDLNGYIESRRWVRGQRYINDGTEKIVASANIWAMMADNTYVTLKAGDVVSTPDTAMWQFLGGYSIDNKQTWTVIPGRQSAYIVPADGLYFFSIRRLPNGTNMSDSELSALNDTLLFTVQNKIKTIDERIDPLSGAVTDIKSTLNNIVGISVKPSDWELGFRYVNNGADSYYVGGNERISTKRGTLISLKKGDCVTNLNPTKYVLGGGYTTDGTTFISIANTTNPYYVAPVDGDYFFRIDDYTVDSGVPFTEDEIPSVVNNFLFSAQGGNASISTLNDNFNTLVTQAKRGLNISANGYLSVPKPLAILHFSDIHGDVLELARIVDFAKEKNVYVDDCICTGDLVEQRWSDGMTWWDEVSGAENIMIALGNHDVMTASTGYDDTQRATQPEQYARYIEPYYSNWGIVSDVSSGLTYYYKDYTDSKIRLIVLNDMLEEAAMIAQVSWLNSVLSDAITNNLSVVIAHHAQIPSSTKVDCNFSNVDRFGDNNYAETNFSDAVDTFKQNGGLFLCYLCGHLHWDQISVYEGTNGKQLSIAIDAANIIQSNVYSDSQRVAGTKSQDAVNVVVFDISSDIIKVIRVGVNEDHYLRKKNCISIRSDGTIVQQS